MSQNRKLACSRAICCDEGLRLTPLFHKRARSSAKIFSDEVALPISCFLISNSKTTSFLPALRNPTHFKSTSNKMVAKHEYMECKDSDEESSHSLLENNSQHPERNEQEPGYVSRPCGFVLMQIVLIFMYTTAFIWLAPQVKLGQDLVYCKILDIRSEVLT